MKIAKYLLVITSLLTSCAYVEGVNNAKDITPIPSGSEYQLKKPSPATEAASTESTISEATSQAARIISPGR